jgi:tetratricopeptide (TPR) repeat protein
MAIGMPLGYSEQRFSCEGFLMITSSMVLLLLAELAAVGQIAPADAPAITPAEIEAAIKQLAADEFQERERATELLASAGEAARAAAEAASKSTDPEVALRAKIVLKRLDSGIRPGTPAPIVALIEEFNNVDQNRKSTIIFRLATAAEFRAIGEQIAKAKNTSERSSLESSFHSKLTSVVSQHFREKKFDEAEQILAALPPTPRSDATLVTFLHLSGRLPKRIEELAAQVAAKPSPAGQQQLALLHRAAGDLPAARAAAEKLPDSDVPLWLACEAGDWPAALRLNRARYEGREPTAPQLAFTLLLAHYAQDQAAYAAAKADFLKRAESKPEELWDCAEALLAAGDLDDAIGLLEKGVPAAAFYLHWYRTHFDKALAFAKAGEGAKFDAAWYQALPDGNTVKTGLSISRYYYARDIASCLNTLGRREEARQVRDLLADAVRGQPPTSSGWTALVSTDLRLGLRDLALEDAAKALEPPAPRRSASTGSLNFSVIMLLYDQSTANSMYSLWPQVLKARDNDPLAALQQIDTLLHPPSAARLLPDERRKRLLDLAGLQGTPDRYQQSAYLRTVGGQAHRLGEEDLAYRLRRQSVSLTQSTELGVRHILANEAYRDQDWRTVAQLLRDVEPEIPNNIGYYDQLAVALEMLGDKTRAGQMRDAAVAARLEPGTIASQASGLLTFGQKAAAVDRYRVVARLLPPGEGTTINAINSLGNALYEASPGEAIPLWQLNMLGPLRGTNNMLLDTHIKNLCVIRRVQARALIAQGKFAEAMVHCQAEMDIMPGNVAAVDQVAPLFEARGQKPLADELFERSYKTYRELCAKYPQSTSQRNILARTCARAKRRLPEAQELLDEALAIDPDRVELLATQAELHLARGDRSAAVAAAEKGLKMQPKHPGCEAMLAKARGEMSATVPDSD